MYSTAAQTLHFYDPLMNNPWHEKYLTYRNCLSVLIKYYLIQLSSNQIVCARRWHTYLFCICTSITDAYLILNITLTKSNYLIIYWLQESDNDLFNFNPIETRKPTIRFLDFNGEPIEPEPEQSEANGDELLVSQKHLNLRKRPRNSAHYSYVKTLNKGLKVIRIEIFDANQFENKICNCNAEMCVQHVVSNTLHDDIYKSIRIIITKISDLIDMF